MPAQMLERVFALRLSPLFAAAVPGADAASPTVVSPLMILILCVIAGIGTVLLLPSRREATLGKIGGALLLAAELIFAAILLRYATNRGQGGMGLYFWIFSAIAILGAVRVITHPSPVYSALYFVLTVLASAGLFVLLWAEFMAAALIIIYAGAILVTYVFVIMLASQSTPAQTDGQAGVADYDGVSREPVVASAVGFALMGILLFVIFDKATALNKSSSNAGGPGTVQALGNYLFRNQLVNLELAGLILTISMIGAIVIARRRVVVPGRAAQSPGPDDTIVTPATPIDDNPHSIPVYGTENPRAKAYPEA